MWATILIGIPLMAGGFYWVLRQFQSPEHPIAHEQHPHLVRELPQKEWKLPQLSAFAALKPAPKAPLLLPESAHVLGPHPMQPTFEDDKSSLKTLETSPRVYLEKALAVVIKLFLVQSENQNRFSRNKVVDTLHLVSRSNWDYLIGSVSQPGVFRTLDLIEDYEDTLGGCHFKGAIEDITDHLLFHYLNMHPGNQEIDQEVKSVSPAIWQAYHTAIDKKQQQQTQDTLENEEEE